MPFPDYVFRHTPSLCGLITPPDTSEMRFGQDFFAEIDAQGMAEGWPPGWRMEDGAREENRRRILSGRLDQDLWVFAYGSLIWDPAVYLDEYRFATLDGWKRSFCLRLDGGRGSHERPGLMAALDTGGRCEGVVFRIPSSIVDRETEFMWRREMFSGSYRPTFHEVATPQGPVTALAFVVDKTDNRYTPHHTEEEAARIIACAEGRLGTNYAYLESLVRHLEDLGLRDEQMRRLLERTKIHRSP